VIRAMPDIIIEPSMDPAQFEKQKETAEAFFSRFSMTPAVKNDRVYVIDGDLVSRLSPRLDQGMELVYQCIIADEGN
jgi:ABC-type Fe3+-hydroxamate transport system substrate-binding protein